MTNREHRNSKKIGKIIRKLRKYRAKLARRLTLARLWLANRFSTRVFVPGAGPVVSLTSYSTRVKSVYLTIESILAGNRLPGTIVLWLDEERAFRHPPASLRRLQRRGLLIRHCRNYGPHKKYYPYVESESPQVPLITADDDVLYPKDWLERLLVAAEQAPRDIVCYKAKRIEPAFGRIPPYRSWSAYLGGDASFRNFAIGVSGVLYPAAFLQVLKEKGDVFMGSCPKTDDIWLHLNALRSGYRIRQISHADTQFPSIPRTQDIALYEENLKLGGNDQIIKHLYNDNDIARMIKD